MARSARGTGRRGIGVESRAARRSFQAANAATAEISTNWSKPVREPEAAVAAISSTTAAESAILICREPWSACSHRAATNAKLIEVANWFGWRRRPQARPEGGEVTQGKTSLARSQYWTRPVTALKVPAAKSPQANAAGTNTTLPPSLAPAKADKPMPASATQAMNRRSRKPWNESASAATQQHSQTINHRSMAPPRTNSSRAMHSPEVSSCQAFADGPATSGQRNGIATSPAQPTRRSFPGWGVRLRTEDIQGDCCRAARRKVQAVRPPNPNYLQIMYAQP